MNDYKLTLKDAQTNVTSIVTQALSISIYTEIYLYTY